MSDCTLNTPKKKKLITKRNYSQANMEHFKTYLNNLTWQDVTQTNDVNESLNVFLSHFNDAINICLPTITTTFNKNFHPKNKFLTPGLIKSRTTKLLLYKTYLSNCTETNHVNYKKYRNIYNSTLRLSKKLYYEKNLATT